MFTANPGERVIDLQTGAMFDVADAPLELDETKYGRTSQGFRPEGKVGPGMMQETTPPPGNLPPEPGADVMRQAKEKSVQEAGEVSGQLFRNVAVPAAQTGLMLATGGMSIPTQMAIGAGSEYALQKTGLAPESGAQIALQGALPIAGRAIEGFKGASRLVGNLMGRGQKAGEQAAAKVMKVPGEVIERSTFAPSKGAYKAVESQGVVDTTGAYEAVQKAIRAETDLGSQANSAVMKRLQGLAKDFETSPGITDVMDAKTMTAKAQRLEKEASDAYRRGRGSVGKALEDAAKQLKGTVPGLKEADVAYTRENVVDDIFGAMRKGKKVEAIDNLLAEKGEKIRGVMSDKELKDLRLIASRIQPLGGDPGFLKTIYNTGLKSFLADPNGLTVFRHAFGPTFERLSPERLIGLMTFVRGYEAQKQRK